MEQKKAMIPIRSGELWKLAQKKIPELVEVCQVCPIAPADLHEFMTILFNVCAENHSAAVAAYNTMGADQREKYLPPVDSPQSTKLGMAISMVSPLVQSMNHLMEAAQRGNRGSV